jgi:pimeloyl-ACP methyl ester carboxylesterase
MPVGPVNGVNLYYEVTGKGFPLVWSHEFGGSFTSWEPQVRFFSRRYQVITYNARGFPPSEVPSDPAAYSQEIAIEDLYQLLRHLDIEQAYVGGLSLGGNIALNFGIAHPDMVKALIVAATGSGTTNREAFERRVEEMARAFETEGMKAVAAPYAKDAHRVQLLRKDPRSYREYYEEFASHSATGAALTARGVMLKRPPISALEPKLKQLTIPTLIMVGDEDDRCIDPALFMKRNIPHSGLVMFPQSGHVINVEEPALFNQTVLDFLTSVEAGTWA